MAKYIRLFKDLEQANFEGAKGLYAPQVNFVSGFSEINFYKNSGTTAFTCEFDENGKMINLGPEGEYYKIKKFNGQPFLGETTIEDFDFHKANKTIVDLFCENNSEFTITNATCSSCRNGNYAGRNLDWFIKDFAMLVMHMPKKEGERLASIGVCSSNPFINREIINKGFVPDTIEFMGKRFDGIRSVFPIFTTDGVNECGVCVNTNVVLHEEGARQGYVPCTGHGGELISFVSLPRYILDNCTSCDDAIAKLSGLSVTQSVRGPLEKEDGHVMVSDKDKTIIFEWYNNEFVYTEYPKSKGFKSQNGLPCVMTNFYNSVCENHTDNGEINWDSLLVEHPYAMGVERFKTLANGLEKVDTIEKMKSHIEQVLYSKMFSPETKWLTENAREGYFLDNGQWKYYKDLNLTISGAADDIKDAMEKCYDTYQKEADKDYGSLDKQMKILENGGESKHWYTELTTIFDIENKCFYLQPQEGWYRKEYFKFTL